MQLLDNKSGLVELFFVSNDLYIEMKLLHLVVHLK